MTAASGPDWGELERRFAPAPEPFWERCGCLEGLGEIPSVSDCHQAGLCRVRQRDRERDEAFAVLLAAARGRDRLAAAITALADEWDTRHADWCCTKGCARPKGQHVAPGALDGWFGVVPIPLPTVPCPGECTCDVALFLPELRALLTTTDEGETK